MTMTKRDLVLKLAEALDMKQQDAMDVVQMTLDTIMQALASGSNVEFRNFGIFELVRRKARIGRNPGAPENKVDIPERIIVKFKPGKELKNIVVNEVSELPKPRVRPDKRKKNIEQ